MVWGIQLFRLTLRNNTVFYQLVKICKSQFSERPLLSDLWEWCITCNYFFCRMTNPWNFVYDKRRYHLCFGMSYFLWHGRRFVCRLLEDSYTKLCGSALNTLRVAVPICRLALILHFEFFDRCVDDFDFAYLSPSFGYSVAKDFLLCECAILFWI